MQASELIELTKAMREAGAENFSIDGDRVMVQLRPPEPPRLSHLREQFGEMPVGEREEFLKEEKRRLEEDLYGASGGKP